MVCVDGLTAHISGAVHANRGREDESQRGEATLLNMLLMRNGFCRSIIFFAIAKQDVGAQCYSDEWREDTASVRRDGAEVSLQLKWKGAFNK